MAGTAVEGKKPVPLEDALRNVESIVAISPLIEDQQPRITAAELSIHYDANMDTGLRDKGAFTTAVSKFQNELSRQPKLLELLDEAYKYAVMLYTWRSCALGIPMIKSNDQPNRMEIYNTTYEILKVEVAKLKDFYSYQKRAVQQFCTEMKAVCEDKSSFISDEYLHTLGLFINMFAVLDELKNIKASNRNDYSAFKRACGILKKNTDPKDIAQQEHFGMFLATNNSIQSDIKSIMMKEVAGYEGLICDIINACVDKYENHLYLTSTEKHILVKVIGFCLYLIDGENVNINKLDSKRKINLNKIDKIFKKTEVVPLYGDMMIGPFKYIENTPNYDPFKWGHCTSDEPSGQAELEPKYLHALRQEHIRLVSELTWQCKVKAQIEDVNRKFSKPKEAPSEPERVRDDKEHQRLYELAFNTLQKLSAWSGKITELFSWKLLHPADHSENRKIPEDAENYEKATKYNYTSEEKFGIVEIIAMIKGVQQIATQLEQVFGDAITRHIYAQLQDFVQVQLREPLRKAAKQKKDIIKSTLLGIRAICTDLARSMESEKDPLLTKLKKDSVTGYKVHTGRKSVPASSTQMYLLRIMLESLVEKKDKNTGRKTPRKDLDGQHITLIENFLKQTRYWPYLLNFSQSLQECCDLSQLWYREFYLEMAKGERIQFPIEMSMPWILTNHVLESKEAQMMEFVHFTLDLYNDSAHWALRKFKKQFLYDEIEAEVQLCFEMFVFKLSGQIFEHYKRLAGSMLLDQTFKTQCQKAGYNIKYPSRNKYENLMKMTRFPILGRGMNLNQTLTQRLNEAFLKALNAAINRFESGPLTGVVELEGLIDCNRLAHRLLSKFLPLDPFDALMQEADYRVSAPLGRISQYIFVCLNADFMPQYCYNASTSRFVPVKDVYFVDPVVYDKPPTTAHSNLWGSKNLTTIFTTLYGQYSHFIGQPHFQAIVQLIGYQDIAAIFKEFQKVIQNIIEDTIVPYIKVLMQVMPKRCRMPRHEYTSPGIFEYYQAQLVDIMTYSDLQPKVFQVLREMGNAVLFCLHLEQALIQKEILEINHAALFQHVIPKPYMKKKGKSKEEIEQELKGLMKNMEAKYKCQNVAPIIKKFGTEEQKTIVQSMAVLTREKLCCGLSIFRKVLEELRAKLSDPVWKGTEPTNGVFNVMENCEFQRLWSALQLVICLPQQGSHTVEMLFGEGLNWAGCTLVTLLGQQRRFEAMDFSYHVMRVYRVDQIDKNCKGVSIVKLADRIRKFQILNDQIFSTLNKYLSDGKQPIAEVPIVHLDPPKPEFEVDSSISKLPPRARESMA